MKTRSGNKLINKLRAMFLLWGMLVVSPLYAQDIEVFLQGVPPGASNNLLFMIDTAGAGNHKTTDPVTGKSVPVVQAISDALQRVVDRIASNTRAGLARYYAGGSPDGSYVAYPVIPLLDTSSTKSTTLVTSGDRDARQEYDYFYDYLTSTGTGGWQAPVLDDKMITVGVNTSEYTKDALGNNLTRRTTHNRTGLMFENIAVPRYATISSAYLLLDAPSTTNGIKVWRGVHAWDDPQDYSVDGPIYNGTSWEHEQLRVESPTQYSVDVKEQLQYLVQQTFWCGKENVSLTFAYATGEFDFYTYEGAVASGGAVEAPRLVIEWDPAAGLAYPATPPVAGTDDALSCSGDVHRDVQSGENDSAEETGTGTVVSDDAVIVGDTSNLNTITIATGAAKKGGLPKGTYQAGFRFPNLGFGPGAKVANAKLHLEVSEISAAGQVQFGGMDGDIAGITADGSVTGPALVPSSVMAAIAGPGRVEIDVTPVVQDVLVSGGWSNTSSMGLRARSTDPANTSVRFGAVEDGSASGAYITMDVLSPSPADFLPESRDALKQQIAALASAQGGGKADLGFSHLDMGSYMRGSNVLSGGDYYNGNTDPVAVDFASEIFDTPYSNYKKPGATTGECNSSHIIMMAGKKPVDHPDTVVEKVTDGQITSATCGSDPYACLAKYSDWLAHPGTNESRLPVVTHIVGFDLPEEDSAGFEKIALNAGGMYRSAANVEEVEAAFEEIVDKVTLENASIAAPGVAVNQLNRFEFLDQLYYSLFRPDFNELWSGNLKRYRLSIKGENNAAIVDVNDSVAVDTTTGFFQDDAQSFWSTVVDGNEAAIGGAREQTELAASRPLFISTSSPGPHGNIDDTEPSSRTGLTKVVDATTISDTQYGLSPGADVTLAYDYVTSAWGDALHSEPRIVTYDAKIVDGQSEFDNTIFVGTNAGMLHAVDGDTGQEQFVFMPQEELKKTAKRLKNNDLVGPDYQRTTYGLDSTWTLWRRARNGNLDVYAFGGNRRGGRNYYGMDVTDRSNPKLLWVIRGGVTPGFADLGESWSLPTLTSVMINGVQVPVLAIGGGYSAADHDTSGVTSGGDAVGNAIYLVNALNGKLIWSGSTTSNGAAATSSTNADMKWSIPASIAAVDMNLDGAAEHLYATDLGGQIFRVDIDNNNTGVSDLVMRVETIAKLGVSDNASYVNHRRLYDNLTAALGEKGGTPTLQIVVGSGYRAHPLEKGKTQDSIMMVEDQSIFTARDPSYSSQPVITRSDLLDVTTNYSPSESDLAAKKGWFIDLDMSVGEKIMGAPVILQGTVFLTAYVPVDAQPDNCDPVAGRSLLYGINVVDGSPSPLISNDADLTDDGRAIDNVMKGIAGPPNVIAGGQDPDANDPDGGDGSGGSDDDPCDGAGQLTAIVGTAVKSVGTLKGCGLSKTRWFEAKNKEAADQVLKNHKAVDPNGKL